MCITKIATKNLLVIVLLACIYTNFIYGQVPPKSILSNDTTKTSSTPLLNSLSHSIGNQPSSDQSLSLAGLPIFVSGQQVINGALLKPTRIRFTRIAKKEEPKR